MTNPKDPAFPEVLVSNGRGGTLDSYTGLTKREYFAAMAFAGMNIGDSRPDRAALYAIEYADALIAELNK